MQVRDESSGRAFLCHVGRPDFTAPELLSSDWRRTVRSPSSDLYALAIHIHQIILEGEHPFRGQWSGSGEKPPAQELARDGIWTFGGDHRLSPRGSGIDIQLLPTSCIELFRRAFVAGAQRPSLRPTAQEWVKELSQLLTSLSTCAAVPSHRYPRHHGAHCPWCVHIAIRHGTTVPTPAPPTPSPPPQAGPRSVPSPVPGGTRYAPPVRGYGPPSPTCPSRQTGPGTASPPIAPIRQRPGGSPIPWKLGIPFLVTHARSAYRDRKLKAAETGALATAALAAATWERLELVTNPGQVIAPAIMGLLLGLAASTKCRTPPRRGFVAVGGLVGALAVAYENPMFEALGHQPSSGQRYLAGVLLLPAVGLFVSVLDRLVTPPLLRLLVPIIGLLGSAAALEVPMRYSVETIDQALGRGDDGADVAGPVIISTTTAPSLPANGGAPCTIVQMATLDTMDRAEAEAAGVPTDPGGSTVIAPSEAIPGWSAGSYAVFVKFAEHAAAEGYAQRIRAVGGDAIVFDLEAGSQACEAS